MADLESSILTREWFYEFTLPSGAVTRTNVPVEVVRFHTTRLRMMWQAAENFFGKRLAEATAIDAASHEGYFSVHLAQRCASVRGIEINPASLAAANLIRAALGLSNLEFIQADLEELDVSTFATADLVLAFGLLYHLESPVRVLRKLRSLTRGLLLIETQTTMLDLRGSIDWSHHLSQTPLHGIFGIVADTPGARESGMSDIALVPSRDGIIWLLRQLGFRHVDILQPPPDSYPELATGRRIMVAASL
jgi:tRNA (mo5U34)-methyltransferase